MKQAVFALATLFFATQAQAHSPVLTNGTAAMSKANPYEIEDPEHSKAIFSTLTSEAHYYRITSDVSFEFYVGITAPKNESCGLSRSFSFDVLNENFEKLDGRDGHNFDWWAWYEEWGKKWYWVGPEIGKDFKADRIYEAGTYYIKVFNEENVGKYVLAVGYIERFSLRDIFTMRKKVKEINAEYWDESDC